MTDFVGGSTALSTWLENDPQLRRLSRLRAADVLPYFRPAASTVAPVVTMEGGDRVMVGSANYLGLAEHPKVKEGAIEAVRRFGSTITGSRLLNGTSVLHLELEEEIADWLGTEASLTFTTGYQANVGAISALVGHSDTLIVDSSCHASILDGCTLSQAKVRPFRHNQVGLLARALGRAAEHDGGRRLVVVEGAYSMEGDVAPLDDVAEAAAANGALLMVDEAHSMGVLGRDGSGAVDLFGVGPQVDVRMGSLSKALGATGGFIAGSRELVDFLSVSARSLLFTTAAVPATLGAALAAIRLCRSDDGRELAATLRRNCLHLRDGFASLGLTVTAQSRRKDGTPVVTPIIPVEVGHDEVALTWWRALYERNVFTAVALFPAVPEGGALLRFAPMATHSLDQLDQVVDAVREVTKQWPLPS